MRPPNYRPSEGFKSCGNCGAFDWSRSYCRMFNVTVAAEFVCDDWEPIQEANMAATDTEQRRDFSQAEREKLAKEGKALPDGSYPIVTVGDLKNAIQAVGRAKNAGAAKAHIKKRARALGATNLLPEDWRSAHEVGFADAAQRNGDGEGEGDNDWDSLADLEQAKGEQQECPVCEGTGSMSGEGSCVNCGGVGLVTAGGPAGSTGSTGGGTALAEHDAALERRKAKQEMLVGTVEHRDFQADMELREASDGKLRLVGYASTTETPYDVMDFTETIASGAFKRTLGESPDVVLLREHEGWPLARTTSGTLTLSEDVRGLRVDAILEPSDPDVQALVPKMQRKDLTEMSFAFRATKQDWNDERTERTIREVSIHRGDVSMVARGANSSTTAEVAMRSEDKAEDEKPEQPEPTPERRSGRDELDLAKAKRARLRRPA